MLASNYTPDPANQAETISQACQCIKEWCTGGDISQAVILGSGLGDLVNGLENRINISYADIPGFPRVSVAGHGGSLNYGLLGGKPVLLFSGRAHFYEHGNVQAMKLPIATLAALGCKRLYLTNAAGGIADELHPGSVMLLNDYVSLFVGLSPLFGISDNARFIDMSRAYDPVLSKELLTAAKHLKIPLYQGSYAWCSGPQFETPAEIRILKQLGCDAVGMSTVPETILAAYYGLKVAALSNITNKAAGLSEDKLSHEHTMAQAKAGADKIAALLTMVLAEMAN